MVELLEERWLLRLTSEDDRLELDPDSEELDDKELPLSELMLEPDPEPIEELPELLPDKDDKVELPDCDELDRLLLELPSALLDDRDEPLLREEEPE